MSFIRALEDPDWEEGIGDGYYVWGDNDGINYMPREYRPFVEVVMRMLDQSNELDEDTLEDVHHALRVRLGLEEGSTGRTVPDFDDAIFGVADAVAFCRRNGRDEIADDMEDLFDELEGERR